MKQKNAHSVDFGRLAVKLVRLFQRVSESIRGS